MRKGGPKVAKEDKDIDVVDEYLEDPEEGMIITLPIMEKKNFKVLSPLENVEEEVFQGHTKEGMTSLMLCYNLYKKMTVMLLLKKLYTFYTLNKK